MPKWVPLLELNMKNILWLWVTPHDRAAVKFWSLEGSLATDEISTHCPRLQVIVP